MKFKKIFTHYQAARQCSKFLKSIPNAEVELLPDTAKSVEFIKEKGDKTFVNGSEIVASIPTSNGIIHVIGDVLLPPAK